MHKKTIVLPKTVAPVSPKMEMDFTTPAKTKMMLKTKTVQTKIVVKTEVVVKRQV
jgi:hypothetical protein